MKKLLLFILILLLPKLACAEFNLTNSSTATAQNNWNNHTDGSLYVNTTVTSVVGVTGSTADDLSDNTTTQLSEGTNLYYTTARARAEYNSTVTGLTYTPATGVLSLDLGYVVPTTTEETNWNTSYGWGDHASAGYALQSNLSVKLDATRGNWKIFYSNDTGVFTELALGADGTFLKSNGAAAAPSFAIPAGTGNASYSTTGGSTAGNVTVVVSEGLIKDGGKAIADIPIFSDVVGLSNLTNYFTKTDGNSTYFQLANSISGNNITNLTWTKIDNIPDNTTSDQATNTTSDMLFNSVNATNYYGITKEAKFGVYNITNTSGDSVFDNADGNYTITRVYLLCTGTEVRL